MGASRKRGDGGALQEKHADAIDRMYEVAVVEPEDRHRNRNQLAKFLIWRSGAFATRYGPKGVSGPTAHL